MRVEEKRRASCVLQAEDLPMVDVHIERSLHKLVDVNDYE
jgi:hypothetical protein